MGVLLLVLKKGLGFIALSVGVLFLILLLNYDPVVIGCPQLQSIRNAINRCIPIIAAIVTGIFVQGIALLYKFFENAVEKHLKELNETAQTFLNRIGEVDEPAYFTRRVEGIVNGYMLYMHVKSPLCTHYEDVKSKYGDLVKDIENHWSKAGEALNEVDKLCSDINQHNVDVRELKYKLLEYIDNLVNNRAASTLPGIVPKYFSDFITSILLDAVVPRVVDDEKKFRDLDRNYIATMYKFHTKNFELKLEGDMLLVGEYRVGKLAPDVWRKHGQNLVIEIVHKALMKYSKELDRYADEGRKLVENAKGALDKLRKELKYVADAKFLPLTKLCRYLR